MGNKNKLDVLVQKGLRRRFFKEATIKDVSFDPIEFEKTSTHMPAYIQLRVHIGIDINWYTMYFGTKKRLSKWKDGSMINIMDNYITNFNETKEIKYLVAIAKELNNWVNDDEWQVRSFCKLLDKITFNKLSNAMKFGLLTKEGYDFVTTLFVKYKEIAVEFDKMRGLYMGSVKDLQIVERWSGGYDLEHSIPYLESSISNTLGFLEKLMKVNGGFYETKQN